MSLKEDFFPFLSIKKFSFEEKPSPISPDLRILRRIAQILLVLELCSIGKKASLEKIQFFLSSLDTREKIEDLLNYNGDSIIKTYWLSVNYNPYVNRACDYALGSGFIAYNSKRNFKMTSLGENFINYILKDKDLLSYEKSILESIGKTKFTEKVIKSLLLGEE